MRTVGSVLPGGYQVFDVKQGGMGIVYLVNQPQFRPEFLARVDRVIPFQALREGDFKVLLDRRIITFAQEIARLHHARLEVTDEARSHLAHLMTERQEGVRGFVRVFEESLVAVVLEHCRTEPKKPVLRVSCADAKLIYTWAG